MDKLILKKDLTISFQANTLTLVALCFTIGCLLPSYAYSHQDITTSQFQEDCTFQVDPQHQTLYCLEKYTAENIAKPVIFSSCASIQSATYQDEYLDLGCTSNGFTGYFMTPNWQSTKIKGDGGVDVTGAPNSILVEGANKALVSVHAGSMVQHSIVVPAEGYIAFDWSYIGGSNLFSTHFSLIINDQIVPLNNSYSASGSHFSELLSAGDAFGFRIDNGKGNKELVLNIDNFQFLTNAIGVTRRQWTAVDNLDNDTQFIQLITFERATLADVIFPSDFDGLQSPILPIYTGYPMIDKDGNLETTADQYHLDESDCAFEIRWVDDEMEDGANHLIHRQWIITDWCSGSIMEETQIIKIASAPAIPKGIPSDYSQEISVKRTKSANWSVSAETPK